MYNDITDITYPNSNIPTAVHSDYPSPSHANMAEDDDGYIGLLLWNEKTQESTFAAYDAPWKSAVRLRVSNKMFLFMGKFVESFPASFVGDYDNA